MSIRDRVNFVQQVKFEELREFLAGPAKTFGPAENIIHKTDRPDQQWIVETTAVIGDFRTKARSAYFRWAMAINGMHVAAERYQAWTDDSDKRFTISSLRRRGNDLQTVRMALWTGTQAAENHLDTAETIAAYGLCDLHACLEEFILSFYRIYMRHHPTPLMQGDFAALKKLRQKSKKDSAAMERWQKAIELRLDTWQRKISFDSLKKTFLAYICLSQLQKPSWFKHTDPTTWADSIAVIALLRNHITHGETHASKELADLCKLPHAVGFQFEEGEEISINLHHMQIVEMFINEFLTAMNASLIERAVGPQPALRVMLK